MSEIDDLNGCVRSIMDAISSSLRQEQQDPSLAGWGQFLEATSPVFQIGPYGTAAGIAVQGIAFPDAVIDVRVIKQLKSFWSKKGPESSTRRMSGWPLQFLP